MSRFFVTTYHGSGSPQISGIDGNTYGDDDDGTIYYYDDGWVSTNPTPPSAPSLINYGDLNSSESITWSVIGGTYTIQISDASDFSNLLINQSGIGSESYAITTFLRDNTILGVGGTYNLATTINSDDLYQTTTGLHLIAWTNNSQIYVDFFDITNSYKAPLAVDLTSVTYYIRVKATVFGIDSAWSVTRSLTPQFASGQVTIDGCVDDGSSSVAYSSDYGQSFHIFSYGDGVDVPFGSYYTTRDGGLFPTHVEASFKTFSVVVTTI